MRPSTRISLATLLLCAGLVAATPALAVDTTPPVVVPTVTGTLGANGWYVGTVKVTWSVTDPESAITKKTGCAASTLSADSAGTTYPCSATSTGGTTTTSVTVKRDATVPTVTLTLPASAGAYKLGQVVLANYACADARSGVASCTGTVAKGAAIDTSTLGAKSFTVSAVDLAGNVKTTTISYTVTDATPPVVTPAVTGTLGTNGWYTSNVGVTWTVTDPESAVSKKTGCAASTLATDSAGTSYPCSATSTGGTTSTSVVVKRDATAPVVTVTTPASAGSYKMGQAVLASYACTDAPSGVASCVGTVAKGAAIDTATMGAKSFTVSAVDLAGNVKTSTVSYTVTDPTPPAISSALAGTLGTNGWYTSDVLVTWTVTDAESAVSTQTGCGVITVATDSAGVAGTTLTCSATSGGGTAQSSVIVKRDTTAPVVTVTVPTNGGTYPTGTPAAASYACTDPTSGVASCVGTVAKGAAIDISTLGDKTFTVVGIDRAGNTQTSTVTYTVTDGTPPVITPVIAGTRGAGGWYSSDVTVTWTVTDPETAVTATTGCDPSTVVADTTGTTFTCSATSSGGTASRSVTIQRDTVAPTASIQAPVAGAHYGLNQAVPAAFTCGDALSGVRSCTGTVGNGVPVDTTMPGRRTFQATATDNAGNPFTTSVSFYVDLPGSPLVAGSQLFAWNDLGMHCADSDYSVFSLLPPFNTLNAQLVSAGKLDVGGFTLTYESTPDPLGSINTSSSGKTNFWEMAPALLGVTLPYEIGLTGFPTPSLTPAPMQWSGTFGWYEATGIPIVPVDDTGAMNPYPMVKVVARNAAGTAVAQTTAVLPVSSEINCSTCHASGTGSSAAMPAAGWVGLAAGSETDWRMNVLRLHDELNGANPTYVQALADRGFGVSLEGSASAGKPVLCDTCHNSNALAYWGIYGTAGISNLTAAMHGRHATVQEPSTGIALDAIGTRSACYHCHPGGKTECLRGAMGNPVDVSGNHLMECQSCHGSMATVGNAARNGWYDVPTCQSCHHDGLRETVAINPDGTFKTWTDATFGTPANTPVAGTSLYRFATGHGGLQCEACHNSTHAEFTNKPSTSGNQVNDNVRAISLQGYAAAIRECSVCHSTVPSSAAGGPHGMHTVGSAWVSRHPDQVSLLGVASCTYCHGATSAGSPLAVVKVSKTFATKGGGTKTFAAEARVTCWSCHNGPNGG